MTNQTISTRHTHTHTSNTYKEFTLCLQRADSLPHLPSFACKDPDSLSAKSRLSVHFFFGATFLLQTFIVQDFCCNIFVARFYVARFFLQWHLRYDQYLLLRTPIYDNNVIIRDIVYRAETPNPVYPNQSVTRLHDAIASEQ